MAKNEILEELENESTKQQFVALMRYESKYGSVIDEGKHWQWKKFVDEGGMWGDKAEYVGISSHPLKDFVQEFELSNHKPRPVIKQEIEIKQKKIADDVISEDIEKMAMDSPESLRELLAAKLEAMSAEATWYRDSYITEQIADPVKLNNRAKVMVPTDELKDTRNVVLAIRTMAAMMTTPNKNFNLDEKEVCIRDPKKDLICVIDPTLKVEIETSLYPTANNLAYINLENYFLKVVDMVMPNDIKVLLVDAKAVGAPLAVNKIYTDFVKGNMCTYLFNHIWFDADLLTHLSAGAIIEDKS